MAGTWSLAELRRTLGVNRTLQDFGKQPNQERGLLTNYGSVSVRGGGGRSGKLYVRIRYGPPGSPVRGREKKKTKTSRGGKKISLEGVWNQGLGERERTEKRDKQIKKTQVRGVGGGSECG